MPVLRDADRMSFAADRAARSATSPPGATTDTLTLDDLRGGTFTITNGGVFGSLMSHADPQPAAGRHPRPAHDPGAAGGPSTGQVVIRPMMYVALTYDHRIVDGREAVQFLVKVKELIEDPASLVLEA